MQLYATVNDIKTEVEALYRNATGKAQLTAVEADIVYSSIVDAYQLVLMEYGVATLKFVEEEFSVATVAGTNYIDLEEYVYRVISGSVRIKAERTLLGLVDEEQIFSVDPGDEIVSEPTSYAYMSSGDPNIMRLRLYPVPNQAYTITMKVLKLPTDTITNFPTTLSSAIKNKSKALCCVGLGIGSYKQGFDDLYEEILEKFKDGYLNDGPIHVGRTYIATPNQNIQGRAS
jgi:hypothetical protein